MVTKPTKITAVRVANLTKHPWKLHENWFTSFGKVDRKRKSYTQMVSIDHSSRS